MKKSLRVSTLVLLFSACNSGTLPKVGTYQGSMKSSPDQVVWDNAVSANVSEPSERSEHIVVHGNHQADSIVDAVGSEDGKSLVLTISNTPIEKIILQVDNACFSAVTPFVIRFCNTSTTISIHIESNSQLIYDLNLEYFGDVAAGINLEKPQSFSLDDAVSFTMKRDFSTRIQIQQMMQAKFAAKQAYLNLLPHLSNSSIIGLATGGPLGVISLLQMAGDLAPFLFPSRWIGAEQNAELSKAQKDAVALVKGNAALQVESFAFSIAHDEQVLANLRQDIVITEAIMQKVQVLEAKALVPAGTADHMHSIVVSLHDGTDDLKEGLRIQHAFLSQAMGFVNPEAVINVQVPAFPDSVDTTKSIQLKEYQDLVLSRSMELRQMDTLIAAAKKGVSADYFSWMDPSADVNHSLGFGLGQQINIDQSQVSALEIQREEVASTLLQNLDTAITQYNHSLDDLDDSIEGLQLQQTRLKNLQAALDSGASLSSTELTTIPNDVFSWQIHLQDAQLEYRSSIAKLQRLLLEAYYLNLDDSSSAASATQQIAVTGTLL